MDTKSLYLGCKEYAFSDKVRVPGSAFDITGWGQIIYNGELSADFFLRAKKGVIVEHNSKFTELCCDAQLFLLLWGFLRHNYSSDLQTDNDVVELLNQNSHIFKTVIINQVFQF